MKTLLLLRHAKSSWKESDLDDHDRPLNKRGKRDAPRMGRLLVELNLVPDFLLSSTAKRARKTAEHVIEETGYRGEAHFTYELYHATPEQLLLQVQQLPAVDKRVLLIGHNPGLEEFLEALTGSYHPLSTAALVQLELPINHWEELQLVPTSKLVGHWQPRELA